MTSVGSGAACPLYRLLGANASPYSMKMRAILRYRRLPFVWEPASPRLAEAFQAVRPAVVPILQFPDGRFANDSTTLAYNLEAAHPGNRSIMPDEPGLRFLSDLVEDMADEWGTKCMFHYRWWYEADRRFASTWVVGDRFAALATQPHDGAPPRDPRAIAGAVGATPENETLASAMQRFHDRQVGRMALVGVTDTNKAAVEESYRRVLALFNDGIAAQPFLFGTRPSLGDFGWFGQLWTLAMDPTPGWLMRERAPHLLPWLLRLDDASGVEGAWSDDVTPWCKGMLAIAGDTYLPFLSANAAALEAGRAEVKVDLPGGLYVQAPFKYQAKCFATLRKTFRELPAGARRRIEPLLDVTGCLSYLR